MGCKVWDACLLLAGLPTYGFVSVGFGNLLVLGLCCWCCGLLGWYLFSLCGLTFELLWGLFELTVWVACLFGLCLDLWVLAGWDVGCLLVASCWVDGFVCIWVFGFVAASLRCDRLGVCDWC